MPKLQKAQVCAGSARALGMMQTYHMIIENPGRQNIQKIISWKERREDNFSAATSCEWTVNWTVQLNSLPYWRFLNCFRVSDNAQTHTLLFLTESKKWRRWAVDRQDGGEMFIWRLNKELLSVFNLSFKEVHFKRLLKSIYYWKNIIIIIITSIVFG